MLTTLMTETFDKNFECSVCGKESEHPFTISRRSCAASGLDSRSDDIDNIQRCPSCGYCSFDISECDGEIKYLVASEEYQQIIANQSIPEGASSCLALSYEKQQNKRYDEAVWATIYAAWLCDDVRDDEGSVECRKQALSLIEKANAQSQNIADEEGVAEAITVDLMRRAGMFQQALKLADSINGKNIEEMLLNVIKFQKKLIKLEDPYSYDVDDVINNRIKDKESMEQVGIELRKLINDDLK